MIILRFREKQTAKSNKAHEASDNLLFTLVGGSTSFYFTTIL